MNKQQQQQNWISFWFEIAKQTKKSGLKIAQYTIMTLKETNMKLKDTIKLHKIISMKMLLYK